jgi:hypothetical protein
VLQRRLTVIGLAALTSLVLAACGDGTPAGDRTLEDNLIRPGITAIESARGQTCEVNASSLRTAIEAFRLLEGGDPADEAALIEAGLLSVEATDWDVADGELVAVNPACESVAPPSTIEIVTETIDDGRSVDVTTDDVFATFDEGFIAGVGGFDCARELAVIAAAGSNYESREGIGPPDLESIRDDFDEPVVLWIYDAAVDDLVPTDGSPCIRDAGVDGT